MNRRLRLSTQQSTEWMLLLALVSCYAYFFPRWADPNQNSRLDMVMTVVEDGTFQIDKYVANTVDYAKVGEHYYSDKPPGAAFLGIPVYAGLKLVLDLPILERLMNRLDNNAAFKATLRPEGSGILEHKVRFAIAQVALAFVVAALPSALLGVLMYRLLAYLAPGEWPRVAVVLGYGLLTPAFAYAGAFYGHQLSAALLFGAFYLVFTGRPPLSAKRLAAMGCLLGYAVITEYPAALIAGIVYLYTLYRLAQAGHWRGIGWVTLTGTLVAAGWMAYNTFIFGGPLTLGYSYSELWLDKHRIGFMSLTWPHAEALWGITFGVFRGLFVLSPLLLLSLPGFWLWWRSGKRRPEFWVACVSVLAMFLFNASSVMWWGGFAVGPRYLLPALPFMALPLIFVFRHRGTQTWLRAMVLLLSMWSLIATWGLTLAGQSFPSDVIRNPWTEYAWPHWAVGNIARNFGTVFGVPGIWSLAPLLIIITLICAGWWRLGRWHRTTALLGPLDAELRPMESLREKGS